jgi:hypothetical protein
MVWRKPQRKRCEATDRNRIVKAEGCEASWHMTAKPTGTQPTVNAALVHRQLASLPGEICIASGAWWVTTDPDRFNRDTKDQALRRAARPRAMKPAAIVTTTRSAGCGAAGRRPAGGAGAGRSPRQAQAGGLKRTRR